MIKHSPSKTMMEFQRKYYAPMLAQVMRKWLLHLERIAGRQEDNQQEGGNASG